MNRGSRLSSPSSLRSVAMLRVSELSDTAQSSQTAFRISSFVTSLLGFRNRNKKHAKRLRFHRQGFFTLDQQELALPDLDVFKLENGELMIRHESVTRLFRESSDLRHYPAVA